MEFVTAYGPRAYAIAHRMLGHVQDAEDVTNRVLFDLIEWARRTGGRVQRDERMVVTVATINRSRTVLRERSRRHATNGVVSDATDPRRSRAAEIDDADEIAHLVESLSEEEWALLDHLYLRHLTSQHTGLALGIPAATVRRRHAEVLKKLRGRVGAATATTAPGGQS